ncbi:NADH-quinone oxidoreductase subunit NuoE [Marinicella rhabdoformis]|uniref:NADH-quinone oxidoreductase subunit NuoE n=1 Tax=Marinicella rhabdoformis TaxID=2580566 RepID=UPI0012AEDD43|nr:NADH-quinone oxidoreductase subunit NuoE [Marinicella rhabdoformis]
MYQVNPQNQDKTLAMTLLTDETRSHMDYWLAKYPNDQRRSAVIGSLHAAQDQNKGWLSKEIMQAVAQYLEIPASWVFEAASFYSMFFTEPAGEHKVAICTNISCMLRGANEVVNYAEQKLGIKLGETTADGKITLVKEEECVAGCVGAPLMIVNGHYHENLTNEKIDQILGGLEA